MNWYLKVLSQYADFNGRARRQEYWMFFLFNMIFAIAAIILDNLFGSTIGRLPYGLFYFLYAFGVLIPSLAVAVRRLHDLGKSGWMVLISLIPFIGGIWLLVLMVTDSQPGSNEYGENPKGEGEERERGAGMASVTNTVSDADKKSDKFVLAALIWMFAAKVFWSLIQLFVEEYFNKDWYGPLNIFFTLVWSVLPIILTLAIRDKSKQVILFILCGLYLVHGFYEIYKYIEFLNRY